MYPIYASTVMIMKTYDSLSSYQQLLLKCSSVIGDVIPSDMLNYVMNSKNPRETAKAVQKLIEIMVLSCAYGDFTQGDATMIFQMRLVNPNKDRSVKCSCKGLKVHGKSSYICACITGPRILLLLDTIK